MTKVFVKAIVNTLVGIFAVAVVTWAIITLAFPSALVTVTSNMGWTKVSAWYAASSYVRTRDLDDLAQAVDMSINVVATKKSKIARGESVTISDDDYQQIVKYGGMLLRQEGFEEFCTERDGEESLTAGTSKNYYYTAMVEARYNTGYKKDALQLAVQALNETGSFSSSGAMAVLSYLAIDASDADWCARIKTEMENSSVEHNEEYETILAALSAAAGGSDGTTDGGSDSSEETGE